MHPYDCDILYPLSMHLFSALPSALQRVHEICASLQSRCGEFFVALLHNSYHLTTDALEKGNYTLAIMTLFHYVAPALLDSPLVPGIAPPPPPCSWWSVEGGESSE